MHLPANARQIEDKLITFAAYYGRPM